MITISKPPPRNKLFRTSVNAGIANIPTPIIRRITPKLFNNVSIVLTF